MFDNSNFKNYSELTERNQGFEIILEQSLPPENILYTILYCIFYIQCPVLLSAIAVPVALSLLGPALCFWRCSVGFHSLSASGLSVNSWWLLLQCRALFGASLREFVPCPQVWSTSTCEFVRTLNGHKRGIACLQYRDRLVVSGSSDNTIRWEPPAAACV